MECEVRTFSYINRLSDIENKSVVAKWGRGRDGVGGWGYANYYI